VNDHKDKFRRARPDMGGLFNRRADLWRPLLAIADEAGANGPTWRARPKPRSGQLPTTTRAASVSNCFATVRDVFGEWKADQTRAGVAPAAMAEIESKEIVKRLVDMEGRPWADLPGRRPGPLTTTKPARLPRPEGAR